MTVFGSVRIIESTYCADDVFDFSGCRSPSRARRRWLRGIPGRVKHTRKPWSHAVQLPDGRMIMHPSMAAEIRKATSKLGTDLERNIYASLYGGSIPW